MKQTEYKCSECKRQFVPREQYGPQFSGYCPCCMKFITVFSLGYVEPSKPAQQSHSVAAMASPPSQPSHAKPDEPVAAAMGQGETAPDVAKFKAACCTAIHLATSTPPSETMALVNGYFVQLRHSSPDAYRQLISDIIAGRNKEQLTNTMMLALIKTGKLGASNRATPELVNAVRSGNAPLVLTMVVDAARANALTDNGQPLLGIAAGGGQTEIARILLEKGAVVDARGQGAATPLLASIAAHHAETAKLLLVHGADANANYNGTYALQLAVIENQETIVSLLLEHGARVDAKDQKGNTALIKACAHERASIANRLIENGASVDAVDNGGFSVLMLACHTGMTDVVKFMIQKGVNVGKSTSSGFTALKAATDKCHFEIARLLRDAGA